MESNKRLDSSKDVSPFEETKYSDIGLKPAELQKEKLSPVICGFGPSGIFAALTLAKHGYRPIVLEQGSNIDNRKSKVDRYLKNRILDSSTNIQFGEGGAGAFSDGKLITRIGDARCRFVLETLVRHGAPEDILYSAKPHVGTDLLCNIVKSIREEIIALGGKVLFDSKLTDFHKTSNGLCITVNGKDELFAPALFIASGHSCRDLYSLLIDKGFVVEGKDFSVGVRIEHMRSKVEESMYGDMASFLPPAEYAVSYHSGERGVYSFCMCPGGLVMASSSDNGEIVTNGMSYHSRNRENSNAAIAVSVLKKDYGNDPIRAIEYQHSLERAAFNVSGDFRAPAQTVGDFLNDRPTSKFSGPIPTYPHGVVGYDLNGILPAYISASLKEGLTAFGRQYSFFKDMSAPLTGLETRTSSPVRIPRGDDGCALGHCNIYPCGEGAGYAGGITSAAVDGIKSAEKYILK